MQSTACLFLCGELSNPINIHKSVSSIAHSNYLAFIRMQVSCYLHNATEETGAHVAGFWVSKEIDTKETSHMETLALIMQEAVLTGCVTPQL